MNQVNRVHQTSAKVYGLAKGERLHDINTIKQLYSQGNSFLKHPLRVVFFCKPLEDITNSSAFPAQVIFTVSKRTFKKAHDRNLLKRRTKEAFRLHKSILYPAIESEESPLVYYISFQYIAKEIMPFVQIEKRLISALKQLKEKPLPPAALSKGNVS